MKQGLTRLRKDAILLLLIVLCSFSSLAQKSFCFKSSDKNNLNLRLTLIDKKWEYGFIRYNAPEYGVPIKLLRTTVLMSGGREYVWEELGQDSVSGLYSMQVVGSVVSDMMYIRSADNNKFLFEETHTGYTDCECNW